MHDVLFANIEPIHWKTKFRMITTDKPKVIAKPVSSTFRIMSEDENMFHKFEWHGVSLK
jgi:hypothetical protein